MNENLMRVLSDWNGGEIRPVLRTAPVFSQPSRPVERRVSRLARRRTDHSATGHRDHPEARAFAATLERLNRGVLLLDARGAVLFTNRSAARILHRRHGLSIRDGVLGFTDRAASSTFSSLIERGEGSLLLRVNGASAADCPYRVLISAIEPGTDAGFCVFIYEPHRGHQPLPPAVLQGLYKLTNAEARLANALYTGQSLKDAAGTLGVSLNTAKTTLKRIFAKCEVRTQAELLLLLSLGPRTL